MLRIHDETEHQEIFHRSIDLSSPLEIHIPSALGPLGYFVCLRIPQERVDDFAETRVAARLSGLRDTDTSAAAGEGCEAESVRAVPAADGYVWLVLCRMPLARGDGTLSFENVPDGLGRVDLLLCTWLRFVESGQAEDWLRCQSDPQWAPSGVPLGGIGTGRVDICRDGRFRNFSGNNNQDMPFEEPDGLAGAGLYLRAGGEQRALATRPMNGIEPCEELVFEPAFPQARLRSPQILPGVDAEVLFSGPVVPHDTRTSSLPVALIRWRVRNTGDTETEIECGMRWPNLVGCGGGIKEEEKNIGYGDGFYQYWTAPDSPTTDSVEIPLAGVGLAHGNAPNPVSQAADGRHFLFVKSPDAYRSVQVDLERPGVSAVASVAPGAEVVVDMLLVWEMPHWIDTRRVDQGLFWQNHFADGGEIAEFALDHFDTILQNAGRLGDLLESTSLPADIRRRLLNCCYPLVTNSVFFRDGRFSINEGPTEMSGCYGTIDQRLGAHPATQLLFPELNATELTLFANVQAEDGAINHDLGHGHLDKPSSPISWPDLCCSFVLQHARHAWTTGDADFANRAWPKVRKAIEKHGRWADAGKGVAQLGKLGTSYDSYHYIGTTAYMGTLWAAALKIARVWAEDEGDLDLVEQIDRWLPAAVERLEEDLWNGRFYRAYASPGNPTNENSHAGMLAGEVFSRLLTGQDVLPRERLASCVGALLQLNCSDQLAVPADEAAPDGGAASLYGWLPYIEAFALTAGMLFAPESTMRVWRRMIAAMQGEADLHPCDTRLMYRPQFGTPSWGACYMTAPASWLVYDAMLDFRCHPEPGILRFNPVQDGTFALVHPRFWALGKRDENSIEIEITRSFGDHPVIVQILETSTEMATTSATLAESAAPKAQTEGPYRQTAIAPLTLDPGTRIAWTLIP